VSYLYQFITTLFGFFKIISLSNYDSYGIVWVFLFVGDRGGLLFVGVGFIKDCNIVKLLIFYMLDYFLNQF